MPSQSGQQTDLDQKFFGLMEAHEKLISQMRSLIVPKQPLDAGAFLDEYDGSSTSPLVLPLKTDRPALITNIIVAFVPMTAATLVIGQQSGKNRTIPLLPNANGDQPIDIQCSMILHPGDTIVLTSAGATSMFIEIMGKVLSGTDWSQI